MKEKEIESRFFDHVSCRIISEKRNIFNEKLTNCLFSQQYNVKHFLFLFKYHQQKVELNTSKKLFVFVSKWQKSSSLRTTIVYKNFVFTWEYTFAERCCFLTFTFEGMFSKYGISVKRKHAKTNKNVIFSVVFPNFCKTKIYFFI